MSRMITEEKCIIWVGEYLYDNEVDCSEMDEIDFVENYLEVDEFFCMDKEYVIAIVDEFLKERFSNIAKEELDFYEPYISDGIELFKEVKNIPNGILFNDGLLTIDSEKIPYFKELNNADSYDWKEVRYFREMFSSYCVEKSLYIDKITKL